MRKIPSLFERDRGTGLVFATVVSGCEWVLAGEGVPTRKWDGTCCLVREGRLFKRYDAKHGKTPPPHWEPAQDAPDEHTGHWPGWLPVGDGPEDRWHREGFEGAALPDGTYELCGPKVGGNPEGLGGHFLIPHGANVLPDAPHTSDAPRMYTALREYLAGAGIEGIVWRHPDGRMAKIKARDFGLRR